MASRRALSAAYRTTALRWRAARVLNCGVPYVCRLSNAADSGVREVWHAAVQALLADALIGMPTHCFSNQTAQQTQQ